MYIFTFILFILFIFLKKVFRIVDLFVYCDLL
jgi:hypothetical protein